MKKDKSDYTIQTVANALRLIEEFQGAEELGVTELSRRLVLHKNNVFRLLATLEQRGYIEQDAATERYRLGVRCLELGQAYARGGDLLRRARPLLQQLAMDSGETAHLAMRRDYEVVHLDGIAADRLVQTGLRTGLRLPLHCTALGKVLLGCAPEAVREGYDREVASAGLEQRTEHTIVDRDKLLEHLNGVRVPGFATDLDECEVGMQCAAAPVYDANGDVHAALSVSGPSFRLGEEALMRRIVPLVTATAERLSRDLGYDTGH